jgi:IS4 transposase
LAAKITDANTNERQILRKLLTPGKLYVLDAGYAQYKLLNEIKTSDSSFVVRVQDNAVLETIEERPLSKDAMHAGVTRDVIARLGSTPRRADFPEPIRIIEIFHKGDESVYRKSRVSSKKTFRTKDTDYTFLLATNRMDLPAEAIALIYRYRWQIELFFRWLKCILGCRHLLAHSQNGVTIQVYCALIASMLITLWTGRKPTKRTFEMLNFYFLGWADTEELELHISQLKETEKNNI